jgi:hypothetical protein
MYDEMIEVDPYCIRQCNSKSWLFGFFYAPKDLKLFGGAVVACVVWQLDLQLHICNQ